MLHLGTRILTHVSPMGTRFEASCDSRDNARNLYIEAGQGWKLSATYIDAMVETSCYILGQR